MEPSVGREPDRRKRRRRRTRPPATSAALLMWVIFLMFAQLSLSSALTLFHRDTVHHYYLHFNTPPRKAGFFKRNGPFQPPIAFVSDKGQEEDQNRVYEDDKRLVHTGNTDGTNHGEGDGKPMKTTGSSRWNPTPEQILALKELYRGGTRTPSTQQIQDIASKLREFGRIEGKNVFYWFQNHKARERLKRRRHEEEVNNVHDHHEHQHNVDAENKNLSALRRTCSHRVEQTKSSSSSSPAQDLVPANNTQNSNSNGTTEDSKRRSEGVKSATWQVPMISSTSDTSQYNNHMIIINLQDKGIIMNQNHHSLEEEEEEEDDGERSGIRTLDLFPVNESKKKTEPEDCSGTRKTNPLCCNCYGYYEFMPLKN